jgi:16S rRNA (guanine527-N7)-methyltransferase
VEAPIRELLMAEAGRVGVTLEGCAVDAFGRYLALLQAWNRKINLTAIRQPRDVVQKHFVDSLATVPLLPEAGRLIDVGSGGGFPGIPIAIARPALEVTLLEATGKKAAFLRAAVHGLSLACRVLESRVERVAGEEEGEFDVAVSRATFTPASWLEWGRRLVRNGGTVVAMTGRETPPPGAVEVRSYTLLEGEQRHVAVYRVG